MVFFYLPKNLLKQLYYYVTILKNLSYSGSLVSEKEFEPYTLLMLNIPNITKSYFLKTSPSDLSYEYYDYRNNTIKINIQTACGGRGLS